MSFPIALVDGNNFICSAVLAFRPDLIDRPVIMASSNDGCVIARNHPAKALGIKMAQPVHEIRHLEKSHGLIAFSVCFPLISDMSNRIVSILEEHCPSVVPYSVDESFVEIPLLPNLSLEEHGKKIRAAIYQQTSVLMGIGISSSKTLAKLGNAAAKNILRPMVSSTSIRILPVVRNYLRS